IPRFAEFGGRISTCLSGMTIPQQLFLSFTPTVTGPHQALSNTIDCDKADDADLLTCRAHVEERSVIFDDDPTKFFEIDANIDIEDALAVYRAFRDGQVSFPDDTGPHFKTLSIRGISRDRDRFLISTP